MIKRIECVFRYHQIQRTMHNPIDNYLADILSNVNSIVQVYKLQVYKSEM